MPNATIPKNEVYLLVNFYLSKTGVLVFSQRSLNDIKKLNMMWTMMFLKSDGFADQKWV